MRGPTQEYLSETGFEKVLSIASSVFSKNVLPQLFCPTIILFQYLAHPEVKSSLTAVRNTTRCNLLFVSFVGENKATQIPQAIVLGYLYYFAL